MPAGVMTFVGRLEGAQGIEPCQAPWPLGSVSEPLCAKGVGEHFLVCFLSVVLRFVQDVLSIRNEVVDGQGQLLAWDVRVVVATVSQRNLNLRVQPLRALGHSGGHTDAGFLAVYQT